MCWRQSDERAVHSEDDAERHAAVPSKKIRPKTGFGPFPRSVDRVTIEFCSRDPPDDPPGSLGRSVLNYRHINLRASDSKANRLWPAARTSYFIIRHQLPDNDL
eukprot:scaffold12637_cov30-Prasinocladus_malaysianus.AAC.1